MTGVPAQHLPRRTSLVEETAETLKEWIATGVLRDVLPGELQLKSRLGVGRDTLRLALRRLTQEGWVSAAIKGQQRSINHHLLALKPQTSTRQLPVTFLSPHSVESRVTLLEMQDTEAFLRDEGRNLRFVAPDIFHLKHPESRLERLVQENPSAAWVLYLASEPMQRWFERENIPTLIYGSAFPGVNLPFVVSAWEAAAFHAGVQLIRHGHRTIGIMEYHERFPGVIAEETGLKRAMATAGSEGHLMVFKDDRTPASVARSLENAFASRERPTALVLTYTSQLLTCYSWFASRGIRVPADVSIISLVNDIWFNDIFPPVCYYRPETKLMSRHIAQRVLELTQTGKVNRKSIRIPLEYVPGASIGPAPREGRRSP
jgi:DNA-binding LacI/PurR family transcriptional regulator